MGASLPQEASRVLPLHIVGYGNRHTGDVCVRPAHRLDIQIAFTFTLLFAVVLGNTNYTFHVL